MSCITHQGIKWYMLDIHASLIPRPILLTHSWLPFVHVGFLYTLAGQSQEQRWHLVKLLCDHLATLESLTAHSIKSMTL